MEKYALHLAMAALVGASFVAVSAYYMHQKTLSQLLEFAKSLERERDGEVDDDDADDELDLSPRRRRKSVGAYRRASSSLPDVTRVSGEADGGEMPNGMIDGIPAGLPKLRTLSEGMPLVDFSPEFEL
uniref:AMP deaminase n=1 Tax=Opuntia streptacantha TaxID=393608 RepID=A0A7C9DS72_OPUST